MEEHLFKEAMREHENTTEEKYRISIDPEAKNAAKELEDTMADALKRLQPAAGLQGRIGKEFRKLGEHKDDISIWMEVLPSDYFSAVCGGIRLVVSVGRSYFICLASPNQSIRRYRRPLA